MDFGFVDVVVRNATVLALWKNSPLLKDVPLVLFEDSKFSHTVRWEGTGFHASISSMPYRNRPELYHLVEVAIGYDSRPADDFPDRFWLKLQGVWTGQERFLMEDRFYGNIPILDLPDKLAKTYQLITNPVKRKRARNGRRRQSGAIAKARVN